MIRKTVPDTPTVDESPVIPPRFTAGSATEWEQVQSAPNFAARLPPPPARPVVSKPRDVASDVHSDAVGEHSGKRRRRSEDDYRCVPHTWAAVRVVDVVVVVVVGGRGEELTC